MAAPELLRLAIERTKAKSNRGFKAEHAVVIGDTTHDICGALDNGALPVGVATGSSDIEEPAAAGTDIVLPSLEGIAHARCNPTAPRAVAAHGCCLSWAGRSSFERHT